MSAERSHSFRYVLYDRFIANDTSEKETLSSTLKSQSVIEGLQFVLFIDVIWKSFPNY